MFYSIRLSRLVTVSLAITLMSATLTEVRQNPQELSKRSRFAHFERVAKMGIVMSIQQSAQQSVK